MLAGILLALAAAPAVRAQGGYGHGYGGGYGYYGPIGSYTLHRLYRHRSGYLFGYDRPYHYNVYGPYGPYGAGAVVPGGGYGPGPGAGGCISEDPRQDFDCRRDRLLDDARRIDVSYLSTYRASSAPRLRPAPTEASWTLLLNGEPVRALGGFAAGLLRRPADGRARIGYALAAAALDDRAAAEGAMRAALRQDPRLFAGAFKLDDARFGAFVRNLVDRAAGDRKSDPDRRLLTASLHCLLHEYADAQLALDDLPLPPRPDPEMRLLREMVAAAVPAKPGDAAGS